MRRLKIEVSLKEQIYHLQCTQSMRAVWIQFILFGVKKNDFQEQKE